MTVRSDPLPARAPASVRVATLEDAERIADLSGQLGYPATPGEIVRRLEGDPQHVVYLAELREGPWFGSVIGWIHVQECHLVASDLRAEVVGLVIAAGHRGRGAGRLLMQHAEQWARSPGCREVLLRSNVIRAEAHAFYGKLGYETLKTQKVFRKFL